MTKPDFLSTSEVDLILSNIEIGSVDISWNTTETPIFPNLSPLLTREQFRARVARACEKLAALPDLEVTPFILRGVSHSD